ncbi:MAG: heparinase II/III domain-containing protein [Cyclobacteriaceae bacterium]
MIGFKNYFRQQQLRNISGHPRLLMTDGKTELIKLKINTDSNFLAFHKQILKHADRYSVEGALNIEKNGKRLLASASELTKRILTLGYAFRLTHDEKYLTGAVNYMNQACSLDNWNPDHYLDVAEITLGVSFGYDWLYHHLDQQTRQLFKKAIREKGLLPSMQADYNRWLEKANNWNQVCNAAMVAGALAVYEDEKELAVQIILRSLESNYKALKKYGVDGNYPEGYGYWSYGTQFQVIMFSALETAFIQPFSPDIPAGFMKTPEYLLNMIGPSGKVFNYSDTDEKPKVNPAMFWFAKKRNNPSLLIVEKKLLEEGGYSTARDFVFLMLWAEPEQFKKPEFDYKNYWSGNGENPVAMMRSGWGNDDLYVGIKGGSPSVSHGHMDAGSFVLDAQGERWVMDPGAEDYNKLESAGLNIWSYKKDSDRWKITRHKNQAHSTITISEMPQNVKGYAAIEKLVVNTGNPSFLADLSSIYEPQIVRANRFFSISGQSLNILDELKNGTLPSDVKWTIITDAEIVNGKSWIELRKNGKRLNLKVESSHKYRTIVRVLKPENEFENQNQGICALDIMITVPANAESYIKTSFTPLPQDENYPENKTPGMKMMKWKQK